MNPYNNPDSPEFKNMSHLAGSLVDEDDPNKTYSQVQMLTRAIQRYENDRIASNRLLADTVVMLNRLTREDSNYYTDQEAVQLQNQIKVYLGLDIDT